MWLAVVVISRDPVMLLSLLKLSVVWVWVQYVCPICTVCICFFGCGVFVLVGVVCEMVWFVPG